MKSVSATAFGGEISVIPWGNYESADWGKYSVTLEATRSMSNEELTIIVKVDFKLYSEFRAYNMSFTYF